MPLGWISAGLGAGNLLNSVFGGGSGGGSASGSGNNSYIPTDISGADTGWQNAFNSQSGIANQNQSTAAPLYQDTLNNQQSINYQPYQQNANQVGQQYGNLANIANSQVGQYQNQAALAGQQQQSLYSGANQLMNNAFDPNMAQYNQSFNNLQGQVNAGQAMRGLGNSAVGGQEANNAASNFGIGWNTQQLANEGAALGSASQASNAGGSQGQLVGANLTGALNAGQQGAGYQTQAGAVPLAAQQMIAGMPAANASAYAGNMNQLASGFSNVQANAIPYMNQGIGAQQQNTAYNTAQNSANANLLTQGLGNTSNPNSPGSWLNNMFSSTSSPSSAYQPVPTTNYNPTQDQATTTETTTTTTTTL